MKKLLLSFLLLLSFSNLQASFLMTYNSNNYCIESYSISDASNLVDVVFSSNQSTASIVVDPKTLFGGYVYDVANSTCNLAPVYAMLGIDYASYNYLMALFGLLLSFGIYFSILTIFSRR